MISTAINSIVKYLTLDREKLKKAKKARQKAEFYLREVYENRDRLPRRILTGDRAEISRGLLDMEERFEKARAVSRHIETLRARGLYIGVAKDEGEELEVLSPDIQSFYQTLRKNEFLDRLDDIEYFLGKVISAYERDEEKDIPLGRLDLFAALNQFNDAVKNLSESERAQLENTFATAAVKDNVEIESTLAIAKKYRALINLLNEIGSGSLSKVAMAIVNTAQEIWPGGNPCIMMCREEDGRQVLVPIAVALKEDYLSIGELITGLRLGHYSIPITPDSWNPYVHFFLDGELRLEKDITRDRFRQVCAGFIDREIKGGILEKVLWGFITFARGENTLLTAPLKVIDPETGKEKTIALFAVLRKGYFSKDDMNVVHAFLKSTAIMLAQIQWQEELRETARDAKAYAREKERYAEHLKKMQEELVSKERLAAAGEVAARASHDFKNALHGMAGLNEMQRLLVNLILPKLDILKAKVGIGLPVDEDLEALGRWMSEMDNLVDTNQEVISDAEDVALGILSRVRDKQIVPVMEYLDPLVKQYNERAAAERKGFFCNIRLNRNDAIEIVRSDLGRVLSNLIKNAFDFGADTIYFSAKRDGDSIVFIVNDNGCGIPPERLSNIFTGWGKTTKGEKGSGIGMVSVKRIVDENSGDIKVVSPVDVSSRGTEVTVMFPRVEVKEEEKVKKVEIRLISKEEASGIEVLYVEDEKIARESTERILKEMGFPVQVFKSAEEAYQAMEDGFRPGLIITDESLPKMQGHAFLGKVAADFYEGGELPPSIIHSGAVIDKDKVAGLENISFLEKPAAFQKIREAVSRSVLGDVETKAYHAGVVSLPEELKDDPVVHWAKLVAHKFNNLFAGSLNFASSISNVPIEGDDLELLREVWLTLRDAFAEIKAFAQSARHKDFGDQEWDTGGVWKSQIPVDDFGKVETFIVWPESFKLKSNVTTKDISDPKLDISSKLKTALLDALKGSREVKGPRIPRDEFIKVSAFLEDIFFQFQPHVNREKISNPELLISDELRDVMRGAHKELIPDPVRLLPEKIVNDPENKGQNIWKMMEPGERKKLAIICAIFLNKAEKYIGELNKLIENTKIGKDEINRINELLRILMKINQGFAIRPDAEKSIAEEFLRIYEHFERDRK